MRLEGARGPLSRSQSDALLAKMGRNAPETDIFERHLAVEEALAGNPLSVGNRVTLLEDGPATYAAMLSAIRGARHHVHIEMYIFEADATGWAFAQALMERARSGIEVRLVFDSVGSMGTPREFFHAMVDAGVEVVEFNPVNAATVLSRGAALDRRNHRKLVIVDGRVAFVGGINISDVYTSGSSPSKAADDDAPWRDTQVRIAGPVVEDLQKSFFRMWGEMLKQPPPSGPAYFPALAREGPQMVRAVEGWLDNGLNPLYVTLISAIESAQSEVSITMAYFVPHEELLDALRSAARRGVKVRLLLPGKLDHWMVFHAGRSYYAELLEAGVRIYERRDRLLHSKTASIDGVWSTVGSTNLDWRSLLHNDEINVVVLGPEFARAMDASFAKDLARSDEVTAERWRKRPPADRLREAAARAIAQLL